jgi:hypothetical protein
MVVEGWGEAHSTTSITAHIRPDKISSRGHLVLRHCPLPWWSAARTPIKPGGRITLTTTDESLLLNEPPVQVNVASILCSSTLAAVFAAAAMTLGRHCPQIGLA